VQAFRSRGRLLDFTVYNPSLAWAAGNIVSDVGDLARFFRALLGGRLLPPALLAEMKTPVEVEPGFGYGLGLVVSDSPCGLLYGHDGGIAGFGNIIMNSGEGTHQFANMINATPAPAAVFEPLGQLFEQSLREAFAGEPCATAAAQTQGLQDGQADRLAGRVALRRPAPARTVAR